MLLNDLYNELQNLRKSIELLEQNEFRLFNIFHELRSKASLQELVDFVFDGKTEFKAGVYDYCGFPYPEAITAGLVREQFISEDEDGQRHFVYYKVEK